MVLEYFNLAEQPFGVTPNPRYLFLSPTHREALASIYYGVTSGRGFTALIAEPGMGKTTLLFDFLTRATPSTKTVFLFQTQPTPRDLLHNLLEDLGLSPEVDDLGYMQRKLNDFLIQEFNQGRQLIVVIDEAQNLDENVLEVVRMLSNFETPRQKLLHLILAGQPALAEKLANPQLLQLRQRISIVAQLKRFDTANTKLYIDHRLRMAGYQGETSLFTRQALEVIANHSGGIPRNINTLCFNALSLACALRYPYVNLKVVDEVIADLDLNSLYQPKETSKARGSALPQTKRRRPDSRRSWWLKAALVLCLLAILVGVLSRPGWRSMHWPASVIYSKFAHPRDTQSLSRSLVESSQSVSDPQEISALAGGSGRSSETRSSILQPPADGNALLSPHSHLVTVQPNQTIFQICLDAFGKYDASAVAQIRELNPGLRNLRRLKIGQKLRLPTKVDLSQQDRDAIAAEATLYAQRAEKP